MKRYLLFYGMIYYPCGGMNDFQGDFDTIRDAIKHFHSVIKKDLMPYENTIDAIKNEFEYVYGYHFFHIYDIKTKQKVRKWNQ